VADSAPTQQIKIAGVPPNAGRPEFIRLGEGYEPKAFQTIPLEIKQLTTQYFILCHFQVKTTQNN
jgi:hypothetical protein